MMSYKITGAQLFDSGKRFAVTMWEYSWMVQRTGRQSEYADWDKVLDEVVERGYDCLRIDAFPHVNAKKSNGEVPEEVTFLPIKDNFMWGNHEEVTVNPRKDLVEFMKKAKERGLYIGLSSWFNDDKEHRKLEIKSPEDYIRIWTETLDLLNEEGLLDMVVWVDLCNEFMIKGCCPGVFVDIFGGEPEEELTEEEYQMLLGELTVAQRVRLDEYFTVAIQGVKAKYPELKYTFSNQHGGEHHFYNGNTSEFDLVEPHIWATDDMEWMITTNFYQTLFGEFPDACLNFYRTAEKLFNEDKQKVYEILDKRTDIWANWSKKTNIPLITTEAWTAVLYEDFSHNGHLGEWDWFKEVAEMGVELAVKKGWKGICTSNFAEPHFEGMWYDVEWHKRMTDLIHNG